MDVLYGVLYLLFLSLSIYLIGRIYPRSWINENGFTFKSFKFEREGKIYEKVGIKKWKTKYPDASKLVHKVIKKVPLKALRGEPATKIPILIKETCVAETTHFVAILLSPFCIWITKRYGVILTVLYAVINIPAILIQRYNRPRLKKVIKKEKRNERY